MKRLCVPALREKNGSGFERTLTRIVREEQGDAAWAAVRDHVSREATVTTDEHRQVNHSEMYQTGDGTDTNHVGSFFSRIQRAHVGIHHRFSLRYFDLYVAELAWREDHRRKSNGQLTALVLSGVMLNPTSRNFCGYWQGNIPEDPSSEDFDRPFAPA